MRSGKGKVDSELQVQLEEDGDGSTRQSRVETSNLWPMIHWERQGISQISQVFPDTMTTRDTTKLINMPKNTQKKRKIRDKPQLDFVVVTSKQTISTSCINGNF